MPEQQVIRDWLVEYLAALLGTEPGEIDTNVSFEVYGLDSTAAAGLSGDLGEWLQLELDPKMANDYPTIDAIAEYLGALSQSDAQDTG